MHEQILAGASGFKLHEDPRSTPAAIDACLRVADETGAVQVALHSTLNDGRFRGHARRDRRTQHPRLPHRGPGGGHAPDIITVAAYPNVPLPTNPTRPHTVNTLDEHLDMLMVCHHQSDCARGSRVRRKPDPAVDDRGRGPAARLGRDLDDRVRLQAMGRIGEAVLRTWQTAHVMKVKRGSLPGDGRADNVRAQRYVAKYTICPAAARFRRRDRLHRGGQTRRPGAVRSRVLRVRPDLVIKGVSIAWAAMGDANASIPTPQPVLPRPMFRCRAQGGGRHVDQFRRARGPRGSGRTYR